MKWLIKISRLHILNEFAPIDLQPQNRVSLVLYFSWALSETKVLIPAKLLATFITITTDWCIHNITASNMVITMIVLYNEPILHQKVGRVYRVLLR